MNHIVILVLVVDSLLKVYNCVPVNYSTPDLDPAGYPVNLVDLGRIQI